MTPSQKWYRENKSYALNHKRMYTVDNPEKMKDIWARSHVKHKEKRNAYCNNYNKKPENKERARLRYLANRRAIIDRAIIRNKLRRQKQKLEKQNG